MKQNAQKMASLADTYAERMRVHPYGFALYHPASTRVMRPGCVGFLDSHGVWTPIAHLEDSDSLTKHGLRFPKQSLTVAKTERITGWDPKVSNGVTERSGGIDLGAGGAATGLPVDASLRLEYSSSSDVGAVLITSSPISRNGYYYQSPFKDWVKANARALLHGPLAPDIKEHGLFVVTQTYTTEKAALTAWQGSQNKAYFGFGADAMGLGEISPHVQWYVGNSAAGWNMHESEAGEGKVVFMAGLAYRRLWPLTVRHISSYCPAPTATLTQSPEQTAENTFSGTRQHRGFGRRQDHYRRAR